MKQSITLTPDQISPFVRRFIDLWREKKHYPVIDELTLGQVIELTLATTNTFYMNDSDGRFFNNSLQNEESVLSWDGDELIDILFFQVVLNIKRRIGAARTFNENDPV